MKLWATLLLGFSLAWPAGAAHASATLMVMSADGAGEGFNDPTPATPIGGNKGKTLGAQRLIAVQHAADLWGAVLDSDVPIIVEATFDPLGCSGNVAVLAQASAAGIDSGISGDGADPALVYPRALAERLAGMDLDAGGPDITAFFNTTADDPSCLAGGGGFYYGLDGKPGSHPDLVNTALHELGHGLGVSDYVDRSTGDWVGASPDAYSTHVLDLTTSKHWDAMSAAERLTSIVNVRKVVWDGTHVTAVARDFLDRGMPKLGTTPAVAGLSAVVADANFGTQSSITAVDAPLLLGNPIDGSDVTPGAAGKIVLLRPTYQPSSVAQLMEQTGGVGVLMAIPTGWEPPLPIDEPAPFQVDIPVLSISDADTTALQNALGSGVVTVHLSADHNATIGTDDQGRVFLDATKPASSSSISHWDTLPRPSLLMEPVSTPGQPNDVDLTKPMLIDLGWAPFCGNGRLDQQETCDDGSRNSDSRPDACRSDCQKARCGDGIVDHAEACDQGAANSDTMPNACRADCTPARCGDGVWDRGEACDRGAANSDTLPDACRSDCSAAHCGDGVEDRAEACDDGGGNSDSAADACRTDCSKAHCGDGVIDQGEACDDGKGNSDTMSDACRADCTLPRCGDGTVDQGEACDDGKGNSDTMSDACRADCTLPRCGDGVKDKGEACDHGKGGCDTHACGGAAGGAGTGASKASAHGAASSKDGGCGCAAVGATRRSSAALWLLPAWLTLRRRRSERRDRASPRRTAA